MLVVSDGDIIKNQVRHTPKGQVISPLGFDRYTKQTFGNKSFIMNALHYMTDQHGLMELRTKDLKLRLLNKEKIKDERLKWQLINVLAPIAFIVFVGFLMGWYRKKKYA
jgi:ABC-2 type transport system permease protein